MSPRSIESIEIGEKAEYSTHISESMHLAFMNLSGDDSPVHVDSSFCQSNGYSDKLGYGFLLTTLLSKVYGTIFPGGNELCLHQECNFKKPFYINDELNIMLEVIQKNEALKLLTVMSKIENQHREIIFEGQAVFQLSLQSTNQGR